MPGPKLLRQVGARRRARHDYQAIGVGIGQRFQNDGIDDAEHFSAGGKRYNVPV